MQTDNMILSIQKVTKNFGAISAVSDFSMDVKKGEIHCLIGPNGAGKTTVFKMITGVYPPTYGKIYLKDRDITNLSTSKKMKMGMSIKMQVPGVYSELTLRENIRIAAQNFTEEKMIEEEIERLIDEVGIRDLGNPKVKNMSHGQQQWLEIAMALAAKPELLLLDEPAAGLGPDETDFTANLVLDLNAKGMTILFIEHDMNFVKKIAQNVTVMNNGKFFAEGDLDSILNNEGVAEIYLGKEAKVC
ncbi:MAG: ABC transporter ATP-binding protein [Acetatifactor sp.]|nr:ABC transporter ATP-binding protein [Acetatifactor sp.]